MTGLDEFAASTTWNPTPARYGRTWEIRLPWTKPPLSANDRLTYMAEARIKAEIRRTAAALALDVADPSWPLDRVVITLVYTPRDKRRRDRMNLAPTLKAAVDGLVQAGLVDDDDDTHVLDMIRIAEPDGDPRLVLVVREVLDA